MIHKDSSDVLHVAQLSKDYVVQNEDISEKL
jgi:hypothetical protein